jgi:hypothetical protein
MTRGDVGAKQVLGTVTEGAEATAVQVAKLGGGTVETDQKVDQVDEGGSVTGVKIDGMG